MQKSESTRRYDEYVLIQVIQSVAAMLLNMVRVWINHQFKAQINIQHSSTRPQEPEIGPNFLFQPITEVNNALETESHFKSRLTTQV